MLVKKILERKARLSNFGSGSGFIFSGGQAIASCRDGTPMLS